MLEYCNCGYDRISMAISPAMEFAIMINTSSPDLRLTDKDRLTLLPPRARPRLEMHMIFIKHALAFCCDAANGLEKVRIGFDF